MPLKDYYEILEISPDSTEASVKKAFRNLAMRYHPDKNIGNQYATQHFREIQQAYEVLSNPVKRSEYDQKRWQSKGSGNRFTAPTMVTPELLLLETLKISREIATMDVFRMDHQALNLTLEQLLNEKHLKLLLTAGHRETNKKLVHAVLSCLRPMPFIFIPSFAQKLACIAASDNELIIEIHAFVKEKRNQHLWDKYKGFVMILIALILSYLIYKFA